MKIRLGIILSEAAYRKFQDNININEAFKELKWNAKLQYCRFKFKDVSPYLWKKIDAATSGGLQKKF